VGWGESLVLFCHLFSVYSVKFGMMQFDFWYFHYLAGKKKLNGTQADESHHAMYLKSHYMITKIFKLYIIKYLINSSSDGWWGTFPKLVL
jgi:hypothetical protein